jgi:predicted dehydrogenase
MQSYYKIAIVGLGSIGRRHLINIMDVLTELDASYTIDLIRSGKGRELDDETLQMVNQVYYCNDAVSADYDVIFVTNPTHLHFETIQQFIGKTKHMFIEKPVFDRIDITLDTLELKRDGVYYVACPLRYTDVIQYLKNNIDLKSVYCARVICSSYLPEWRLGQDYRNTYSAHKEEGGGVSIDLIHEWDYLCYLFGHPNQVFNINGKFSNLDIDSDDLSLYIAEYPTMAAEVHLDYFGRQSIREIHLFTADDTVVGDLIYSEIRFLKSGKVLSFKEMRNDFQRKEIAYFFEILEGKAVNDNDLSNALNTLRLARGEL